METTETNWELERIFVELISCSQRMTQFELIPSPTVVPQQHQSQKPPSPNSLLTAFLGSSWTSLLATTEMAAATATTAATKKKIDHEGNTCGCGACCFAFGLSIGDATTRREPSLDAIGHGAVAHLKTTQHHARRMMQADGRGRKASVRLASVGCSCNEA